MSTQLTEIAGARCVLVAEDGPALSDSEGARTLIEVAMGERASLVVLPVGRLGPSFFELRSGLAGELLQKMINYHLKVAIVGDITAYVAASDALRDFVIECNRGRDVFFEPDVAALERRLTALRSR
jgi:hypothetical protein